VPGAIADRIEQILVDVSNSDTEVNQAIFAILKEIGRESTAECIKADI
jgi:hypothetical protein